LNWAEIDVLKRQNGILREDSVERDINGHRLEDL
jgi:hypothetical protein